MCRVAIRPRAAGEAALAPLPALGVKLEGEALEGLLCDPFDDLPLDPEGERAGAAPRRVPQPRPSPRPGAAAPGLPAPDRGC